MDSTVLSQTAAGVSCSIDCPHLSNPFVYGAY